MKLLVAHSGAPSATLNAGLVGLVDACRDEGEGLEVWGARRGLEGLLLGDWAELTAVPAATFEEILRAPGSVIGSSRPTLKPDELGAVVANLDGRGVGALIVAGGRGSMATAAALEKAARDCGSNLRVIGLPHTADNDVTCTDHTPGFASAARFFALAARDIDADNRAVAPSITIVETLGRSTGWLAAATALARSEEGGGPHLIYLPERQPEPDELIEGVRAAVSQWGRAVIVACEEMRGLGGARRTGLAAELQAATGVPARAERLGLLGRCCSWALSEVDIEESYRSGRAAAEAALGGASGVLIALRRQPGPVYRSYPHAVPLSDDPGRERPLPAEWLGDTGAGATQNWLEWVRPLVDQIPSIERIL